MIEAALSAVPALAALPDGTVVLVGAASVAEQRFPALLALEDGSFSALELTEAFVMTPENPQNEPVGYRVGEPSPQLLDPTAFVPPATSARFYDPELLDTRPARVVSAAAAGEEAHFEVDGQVVSLTSLLTPSGSALVFPAVPVPEPGSLLALASGCLALARLARRPRKSSHRPAGA